VLIIRWVSAVLLSVVLMGHSAVAESWNANRETPTMPKAFAVEDDQVAAEDDRLTLVKGNTAFACDLYEKLRREDGNVVYSPFSLSAALAMTYAGGRGETAEQMAKMLHFTLPPERLHTAAGALIRDLASRDDGKRRRYQLHVANAIWGQKNYGFLDDFRTLTRDKYGASLTEVDFLKAREQARKTINGWVEQQTQDKIRDLLQANHLTSDMRLVLTNAIYFKADWEVKFFKSATTEQPFQVTEERKVDVPMMDRTGRVPYLDGGTFQMVDLPYTRNELSMLVLLPTKVDGLQELEKSLTADKLAEWHGKLKQTETQVLLPRFKVTGTFELSKVLTEMGMGLPFGPRADLSGMNGGREPLQISAVVHQTFVDVNEEGTEAAAATAVSVARAGLPMKSVTFRADHPFVFLIRDNRSGSIMFLGRVLDPTRRD
jgi:serine protease inhibitor